MYRACTHRGGGEREKLGEVARKRSRVRKSVNKEERA